jgi:hypothetical protein
VGFIDTQVGQGRAVESVCRVLRQQGCQVAARTYRVWKQAGPSARDLTDAHLMNRIVDVCWTVDRAGQRRRTPESLYGRRR